MTAALFGSIPLPRRVRRALKRYDAHLYIPGPGGVLVQGFQPGNYVESTGVTPGSVDGLVGLALDAANGALGENIVAGGDMSSTAGWTVSGTGASLTSDGSVGTLTAGSTTSYFQRNCPTVVDRLYRVTVVLPASIGSGAGRVRIGGTTLSPDLVAGENVRYFAATSTTTALGVTATGATGTTVRVDDISVREVTGIHASQVTQGYKPYLRRGIVNLLTWSDDRSNAAWTKDGVTASGSKLVESATTAQHRALNGTAVTLVADASRTYAAIVDPAERSIVRMSDNLALGATYNLSTRAITSVSGGVTASMATLSNGRKLLVFSNTTSNTSGRLVFNLADSSGATTYAGDGTSGVYLYSAGLFQGALTAQQILDAGGIPLTTSAPASSANGRYYWQCDAIDDKLVMTFPAGWESATIIDSKSTGQVTQTAQNIVGTYNISTSTYGRIFCRLAPSASDLALLQKFANILSGYVA